VQPPLPLEWRIRELERTHTTIAILAHCTTPTNTNIKLNTFHPVSLFCFPPPITTIYATMVANSRIAAKDMRNPMERHMEQKYRSFAIQSSFVGKWMQEVVEPEEEQLRWRPMVL
jgi:hypothetical protein